MKRNQLGRSDLFVSEVGFGTMSLPANETEAIKLIHNAMDQGITFFDTADLYEQGRIETVLGKAIKGHRDEVILASKVGNHWESGKDGWFWDPSKTYIKKAIKGSLKRLGVDYLDLYQLHGGTLEDPIEETIEAFEELKQEGLIRWYGISSIRPNVIREYVTRSNIVSVMMQYSLLDRRPEETVLDLLYENQISVIARGPVAKGLLSANGLARIPSNGYLDYSPLELESTINKLTQSLPTDMSLSHAAIRYVLTHPAVATVIPGASRSEQVIENAEAAKVQLTDQVSHSLRDLTKPTFYDQHR